MSLTKLDCDFYKGAQSSPGNERSCYVAFNPTLSPGNLVVAESTAVYDKISSYLACRLALEHFTEGILGFFDKNREFLEKKVLGEEALEEAFKSSNRSVYEFGHKMAAADRMTAALMGTVIQGQNVSIGRVGRHAAYLLRAGEVLPFFDSSELETATQKGAGTGSVCVDLTSIALQEEDKLLLCSEQLSDRQKERLTKLLPSFDWNATAPATRICHSIFLTELARIETCITVKIGPKVHYLKTSGQGLL